MSRTSSPSLAKSAERIDGAMTRGFISPGPSSPGPKQRAAPGIPGLLTVIRSSHNPGPSRPSSARVTRRPRGHGRYAAPLPSVAQNLCLLRGGTPYSQLRIEAPRRIAFSHCGHRQDLDLRGISSSAELLEPLLANFLHCFHGWFQELARIKLARRFLCNAAKLGSHSDTAVCVDVHFANAMFYAAHDFFNGYSISLAHSAAIGIEPVLQFLRNR